MTDQKSSSSIISYLILALSGFLLTGGAYYYREHGRITLTQLSQKAHEAEIMAKEIQQLRGLPSFAATNALTAPEISELIIKSAKSSQIPRTSINSINAHQIQRLPDTPYQIVETEISTKSMNIAQITQLFQQLQHPEIGLWVRDCNLRPQAIGPRNSPITTSELWDTNFTLTQLVFSPKLR